MKKPQKSKRKKSKQTDGIPADVRSHLEKKFPNLPMYASMMCQEAARRGMTLEKLIEEVTEQLKSARD